MSKPDFKAMSKKDWLIYVVVSLNMLIFVMLVQINYMQRLLGLSRQGGWVLRGNSIN